MRSKKLIVVIILIFVSLTACKAKPSQDLILQKAEQSEEGSNQGQEADADRIYVYVCGAVVAPGVYELPGGSRVYEAIATAGGFREDAMATEVNQAEVLEDEMRIYVPTVEEMAQETISGKGKVNLNRASKEELMTLPGVGESRAESIIQFRKEQGSFKNIEDIMQISGIKEALFEKIKDFITV